MVDREQKPDGEFNPYKAPLAEVGGAPLGEVRANIGEPTEAMLKGLKGTGPWATLLAILGFIAGGFMLLSGFSSAVAVPFIGAMGQADLASFTGAIVALSALFYIAGGAAYGISSYYLARYSQAIGRVGRSQSLDDIEGALGAQHKFWRTVGIATIAITVITVLFMIISVATTLNLARSLSEDVAQAID